MISSHGNTPRPNESVDEGSETVATWKFWAGQLARKTFRFGLLELLLMTAAIAVWIPPLLALRKIPELETDIQIMRRATLELLVEDPSQLTIRALPTVWQQMHVWKYSIPAAAGLELRMATEGLCSLALPTDYQAISLPAGEHVIRLKKTRDNAGFHNLLYMDGELVLEKHHPDSWLDSSTSSSTTDVGALSQTFSPNGLIKLLEVRAEPNHPLKTIGSRNLQLEGEQDHKGLALWISPAALEVEAAPNFISRLRRAGEWTVGNRNGIRVRSSTEADAIGLMDIQPALDAVLGEQSWGKQTRFAVSVRPVVTLATKAEPPEHQRNGKADVEAIPFLLHMNPTLQEQPPARMRSQLWSKHAVSADGTMMTVFAHYKPFPSGAQPIIEITFDSHHPRRIGFLPRAAPGSTPMQACEFVTHFDSRFFWRRILLKSDEDSLLDNSASVLQSVPIEDLNSNSGFLKRQMPGIGPGEMPGYEVPLNRMSLIQGPEDNHRFRKFILRSDVSNVTKVTFPSGLEQRWKYDGIPNCQVWWLPAEEEKASGEPNIKVDISPTEFFPDTEVALPGGKAVGNVRITVPMPATNPIWLSLEPDTFWSTGESGKP